MNTIQIEQLFIKLFHAQHEDDIDKILTEQGLLNTVEYWKPLGGNENNFAIVQNQQSKPIAALVEKITNSIDAILMRRCLEEAIDPTSTHAPHSMDEAITRFFPQNNWDLQQLRRNQAEEIQIIADGPKRNTSVIMYDNGEGQHPDKFEDTFLSLVRGNKINYHFVQGKYNMGGSGAIAFCGKKRYQLIASKRFDNTGDFGFTLIRQNNFDGEAITRRASKFEYLVIGDIIPRFPVETLDLKLHNRKFKTGTILKLYSYQFPTGYSAFSQELNQSLNEFLFEPALPLLTVDNAERYPNNKILVTDLFGLKRRLEKERKDYIEDVFSETYLDSVFGEAKVTCYVFKAKREGRDVKQTKDDISSRYYKNGMAVMFSINGQVHGHYTSEFITRTLKFNLLKDYLLIHVDCTNIDLRFREELFMASRDRLKEGDESNFLRKYLGDKLQKSRLSDINKKRRETIGLEGTDTSELIRSFAKNLPKDSDMMRLLQNTLKLQERSEKKTPEGKPQQLERKEEKPFNPQRYPTQFHYSKKTDGIPVVSVPLDGERTLKFETDVEDEYFDRSDDPGTLQLGLLKIQRNIKDGGSEPGTKKEIADVLNVVKSSPQKGAIRITLSPTKSLNIGDEVEINISISSNGTAPTEPLQERLLIKIVEQEKPKESVPKDEESLDDIGLPELIPVRQEQWENLEAQGISMSHEVVMRPLATGDLLEKIYINLDSRVFLNYRTKLKNEDQLITAEKRYLTSVYFHVMFLYMITKKRGYELSKDNGEQENITLDDYLSDVFNSSYAEFLLNFGSEQLMSVLGE